MKKLLWITLLLSLTSQQTLIVGEARLTRSQAIKPVSKPTMTYTHPGGGELIARPYKYIRIFVTYYTNIDDELQGGQLDRRGVPLVSHHKPVAMPADVPYGSVLDIEGLGEHNVVDTGGAIVWLDENTCKVDMFIPNVTVDWIINNTENTWYDAKLYY